MGLFQSLFGRREKTNFGELIPDPPQFQLAPGSQEQFQEGIQGLIDVFQRRAAGEDQFDFIKFLFEPQLARLNRAFGIDSEGEGTLGPLGRRQGALGRLEADLQRRGLFDTGSSGVLAAQLESERAQKEAELFGQAKQLQRADIDASLQSLANLFPTRFQVQNIPSQLQFQNEQGRFQAQTQRDLLTEQQRQTRPSGFASVASPLLRLTSNLFSPVPFAGDATLGGNIFNFGKRLFGGSQSPSGRVGAGLGF